MTNVLIGRFVATYDEAAAGCLLDADTAEALAKEFKRMEDRINQLEAALEGIVIDDGGMWAGDPGRWPQVRAAEGLAGKGLTQGEFKDFVAGLRAEAQAKAGVQDGVQDDE